MRLVSGTKFLSPRLDSVAKMASSHNGTCPRDLLQGLVPSCVPCVSRLLFKPEKQVSTGLQAIPNSAKMKNITFYARHQVNFKER